MPVVQLQVAEVSTIEEENTREDNSIEELEFRGDTHADIILDGLNKLRSIKINIKSIIHTLRPIKLLKR